MTRGRAIRAAAAATLLTGHAACGGDAPTGPSVPEGALRFATVAAGYFHTCGLTPDGRAFCWGGNAFGALGDGTNVASGRPVAVAGGHRFASLEAGAGHSCGVTTGGQIYCWGLNDEGQAGADFAVRHSVREPVAIAGSRRWVDVSAGHDHSCGRTDTGEVWCWGDNVTGHLGSGDTFARSWRPVRAAVDGPLTAVVASYYQTCALDATGRVYCWGRNDYGQIGDGTMEHRFTPVPLVGDLRFRALGGGDAFMCGVETDGSTWCWGSNLSGERGDPNLGASSTPTRVPGVPALVEVFGAGGAFTVPGVRAFACGLAGSGEAWCWGGAIRGGLWEGDTNGPLRVDPTLRFQSLALGAEHLCGVTADGWAFCGGANYAGQLGDGTGRDRSSMVGVIRP